MTEPDRMIDELRCWISAQMGAGRGLRQIAKEAGLSDATLLSFDSPKWNPTLKTIRRISLLMAGNAAARAHPGQRPPPHTEAAA